MSPTASRLADLNASTSRLRQPRCRTLVMNTRGGSVMSDPTNTDRTGDRPNRETRRRERFRPNDTSGEEPANPAFGTGDEKESYAGRPDRGVVKTPGAGTGGATESDDRVKPHEGVHLGNQPNS